MKFFIDTEFYEKPGTISLISLAIVGDDGKELYVCNKDYDRGADNDEWLIKNVMCKLPDKNEPQWVHHALIRHEVLRFIGNRTPEFYGYYCQYDWVVFCWVFGRMIDLPNHFPMYCNDIKQMMDERGLNIKQVGEQHSALDDARWVRDTYNKYLREVA